MQTTPAAVPSLSLTSTLPPLPPPSPLEIARAEERWRAGKQVAGWSAGVSLFVVVAAVVFAAAAGVFDDKCKCGIDGCTEGQHNARQGR